MSWKYVQYDGGKYRTTDQGGGASEFADLDDVSFSNLQNGQIPKYNSTTQKWENANESGGTVTDVTVDGTSVVNGQGVAEITTPNADGISYDNQTSGLTATDVQSAIDEIAQGGGGGGNVDDVEVNGVSVVNASKVAEITSYKEVTQAQYNALPSSKLSDDVMYCITDAHGADGYPPLIYSDEEREVGVWRDGKPLYQKVINLNNAEIAVDTFYEIPNTDKTQYDTYVYCYLIDSSRQAWCATAGYSGNYVAVVVHSNRTRNYQYAIIQYTKTTDTPGSGTWTTQGAYAHHYSTSEHVVGTWINGKPLYEKTIAVTSGFATTMTYDPDISNIDRIIKIDGAVCVGNGSEPLNTGTSTVSGWDNYVMDVSANSINIHIGQYRLSQVTEIYIILTYTKTTD